MQPSNPIFSPVSLPSPEGWGVAVELRMPILKAVWLIAARFAELEPLGLAIAEMASAELAIELIIGYGTRVT